MAIFEDVVREMKAAMRAREKERLSALRGIRAALLVRMKEDNSETLSDAECIPVLRRLEKQRMESIDAFERAGRAERAAAERAELGVVQSYLPRLADETATRAWVDEAIASTGAAGPGDLGRVMGALMGAHKGAVDGGLARRLAQEALAELDSGGESE